METSYYDPIDKCTYRLFEGHYTFNHRSWGVQIWATTREEAEMKLKAVGSGQIDGPVIHIEYPE